MTSRQQSHHHGAVFFFDQGRVLTSKAALFDNQEPQPSAGWCYHSCLVEFDFSHNSYHMATFGTANTKDYLTEKKNKKARPQAIPKRDLLVAKNRWFMRLHGAIYPHDRLARVLRGKRLSLTMDSDEEKSYSCYLSAMLSLSSSATTNIVDASSFPWEAWWMTFLHTDEQAKRGQ